MSELEKLQNKPRETRTPLEQCIVDAALLEEAERDGEIELMEQAATDLAVLKKERDEAIANNNKTMCAYCGFVHEDKSNLVEIIEHIMKCEKRPERTLLDKAFEVEDRLYQKIIHLTEHGYNPDDCETCKEIAELLRVYNSSDEGEL